MQLTITNNLVPHLDPRIDELRMRQEARSLDQNSIKLCQSIIYDYYQSNRRSFVWRENPTPYNVVVSEIMLQQTQTDRVAPKFDAFVNRFSDFQSLATSLFPEILALWKGLGYNRRALALQTIAQKIVTQHGGELPQDIDLLESFPSIGPATARSITTFAFNIPTVFIETNVRTVFIHLFKPNQKDVTDRELHALVEATLDHHNPRAWYYALMDYGVMLKKIIGNASRASAHYQRQTSFQGSDRQIRGLILQVLLDHDTITVESMLEIINKKDQAERVERLVMDLQRDKLVVVENEIVRLAGSKGIL